MAEMGMTTLISTLMQILVYGNKGDDDINLTSSKKHTVYGGNGDDEINANSNKPLYINGEMIMTRLF